METSLSTALVVVSVGILVLLLVLSLLAGLIYLLTGLIKDQPEEEAAAVMPEVVVVPDNLEQGRKIRAALIGVALARAQAESAWTTTQEESVEVNTWRLFHRSRRLNQSLKPRRAS